MADEVSLSDRFNALFKAAADYIGDRYYQRVKLTFGQDGTATDVSAVDPLPMEMMNANANGPAPSTNSAPIVMAYDQDLGAFGIGDGEYVAASASNQALGASGAAGDFLSHVTIVPETTTPGAVSIKDGSGTARTIFVGGTIPSVISFAVPIGLTSTSGAWQITTGDDVHVFGVGRFT